MRRTVLLSPPDVGPLEREALPRVGEGSWFAPLGPEVDAFEREVADRVGAGHGVALSSGTAALHLGLRGLGVFPGSLVVTTSFTFAATANAAVHAGAVPYFVDCSPETGNLCPDLLDEALRLSAQLRTLLPGNPEVGALVALQLAHNLAARHLEGIEILFGADAS